MKPTQKQVCESCLKELPSNSIDRPFHESCINQEMRSILNKITFPQYEAIENYLMEVMGINSTAAFWDIYSMNKKELKEAFLEAKELKEFKELHASC